MEDFERITLEPKQHPTIRTLDVTVAEVLESLAESELPYEDVAGDYPGIEEEDIYDALMFAAEVLRSHFASAKEKLSYPYLAAQLALKFPATEKTYTLFDAEDDKPIGQITPFQLEYLKRHMTEPTDEDEGWYFDRVAFNKLPLDQEALTESVEEVDDEAVDLEEKLNAKEADGELVDRTELAKLVVKSELFETKADELEELFKAIAPVMADYDAIELYWEGT